MFNFWFDRNGIGESVVYKYYTDNAISVVTRKKHINVIHKRKAIVIKQNVIKLSITVKPIQTNVELKNDSITIAKHITVKREH